MKRNTRVSSFDATPATVIYPNRSFRGRRSVNPASKAIFSARYDLTLFEFRFVYSPIIGMRQMGVCYVSRCL